jgi:hypothetical protein
VPSIFTALLNNFTGSERLRQRILLVLEALPEPVQRDFIDDPRFRVTLDTIVPGQGRTLLLAAPGPAGSSSRCVVLKPRLANCTEEFAHYVIAHEFAHAYLRNGGWGEITDVEEAADALAAAWGFERPQDW